MRKGSPLNTLSPDLLLRAYSVGIFPMSKAKNDPNVYWVNPKKRGILPLDRFHISKSLKKVIRQKPFTVTFNNAFHRVVECCSGSEHNRKETWINKAIEESVIQLHEKGFAHSVECWDGTCLVGGLYGVALGSAFFGESMFSKANSASKVALVYLVAQLRIGNYQLLDTQFKTDHLAQFGVIEISSNEYLNRLEKALKFRSNFQSSPETEVLLLAINHILENSR